MAASSMKDIKLRIRSVQSTRQITSAMQLVAGSKLRRARQRMEDTRPYMIAAREVIADIAAHREISSPFFHEGAGEAEALIIIAGDRGLAGHYNAAVFQMADSMIENGTSVVPIGKKAVERYSRRGARVLSASYTKAEGMPAAACREIAAQLIDAFLRGEIRGVTLIGTRFVSAMTQEAVSMRLLPAELPESAEKPSGQMIMEPGADELLRRVMPDYLAGCIYAAVCDAVACEMASRRNAMDSATKNADQMIDDLSLRYNRARQGSITQEITEIVAGAEN